ncbi:universal stress protein [Desulfatirhabdium butyrativorans]|uniref:universal stress protein n=1 Tax=Desulfatirhabdium butyrativorans TaxID=340467 RepID=UPI00042870C8|nr:universal stress protein [Desulfatirhabdium butyrativorans]
MFPEIKRILYATDLSENAKYAFGYAARFSNRFGAAITVFHVIEELNPQITFQMMDLLGEEKWRKIQETRKHEAGELIRQRLEDFCKNEGEQDAACSFLVKEIKIVAGHPVEEIIEEAHKGGYDLIVMGTHGHGILAGAMMGSTAMRVLRRSRIPVTVVRLEPKK